MFEYTWQDEERRDVQNVHFFDGSKQYCVGEIVLRPDGHYLGCDFQGCHYLGKDKKQVSERIVYG